MTRQIVRLIEFIFVYASYVLDPKSIVGAWSSKHRFGISPHLFWIAGGLCLVGVNNVRGQTWTPLFKGIEHTTAQVQRGAGIGKAVINVLRIDLTDPDIELFTTPRALNYQSPNRETLAQTVSDFLESNHLQVAINANSTIPQQDSVQPGTPMQVLGLQISQGLLVSTSSSLENSATFLFTTNNRVIFSPTNFPPLSTFGIYTAFAGENALVINGLSVANNITSPDPGLNPRTVIGASQDGRYLLLMTVDGRQPGYSDGAEDEDSARWIMGFGAYNAINMHGGGSTTMVAADCLGSPVRLNRSSTLMATGHERAIGSHLGVRAKPIQIGISDITVNATFSDATIHWHQKAGNPYQILYGLTTNYTSATSMSFTMSDNQAVVLGGLNSDSLYYFQIQTLLNGRIVSTKGCFRTKPDLNPVFDLSQEWRFGTNNLDGSAWFSVDFKDQAWEGQGPGLLYVETSTSVAPKRTPLPVDPVFNRAYVTYYFRTHFLFPESPQDKRLNFEHFIDDGAVFYLNGAEIQRVRMPPPPAEIANSTRASAANLAFPCNGDAQTNCPNFFEVSGPILTTNLVQGDNVLAVEVHNFNLVSPDIVFGCSLSYTHLPLIETGSNLPPVFRQLAASNVTIGSGGTLTLSVRAEGSAPIRYQWFRDGLEVEGVDKPDLVIRDFEIGKAGIYYVVAGNAFGSITGLVASVNAPTAKVDAALLPQLTQRFGDRIQALIPLQAEAFLAAGKFSTQTPNTRSNLVRFQADGTPDGSFNSLLDGEVRFVCSGSDGSLLVGGDFSHIGGVYQPGLGRLFSDGSADRSFAPSLVGTFLTAVADADGRYTVGGELVAGKNREPANLVRLRFDGSVDPNFTPPPSSRISAIALQPDGRLLVAGNWSTNATPNRRILRLKPDGLLDPSFDSSLEIDANLIWLQADGSILVGGEFGSAEIGSTGYLARLLPSGMLDAAFKPNVDGKVHSVAVRKDGNILIGGEFGSIGGVVASGLGLISKDGAADPSFLGNFTAPVLAVAIDTSGRVLAGSQSCNSPQQCPVGVLARFLEPGDGTSALSYEAGEFVWRRGEACVDILSARFESSADGQTWEDMGYANRVTEGWRLRVVFPTNRIVRSRGMASCGTANSSSYVVDDAIGPPRFLTTPKSLTAITGQTIDLAPSIIGAQPITYIWTRNGQVLQDGRGSMGGIVEGASRPQLSLRSISALESGDYALIVSNGFGSLTSAVTRIDVALGSISGTVWDDRNGNGRRDQSVLQGTSPVVVFTIDVSSSTKQPFLGSNVGDLNLDGLANTILDGEIAGLIALNRTLIQLGYANTLRIAIVTFATVATVRDMQPVAEGLQAATFCGADLDLDGFNDVELVLRSIQNQEGTFFRVGLRAANDVLDQLRVESFNGNILFLSDGEPTDSAYDLEANLIRAKGTKLRAFGAGSDATLSTLRLIDPDAQIFTSSDELRRHFDGPDSSITLREPGLPGQRVFVDLNGNGSWDPDEPFRITRGDDPSTPAIDETGTYQFQGMSAGTYSVAVSPMEDQLITYPSSYSHLLTIGPSALDVEPYNFGLTREARLRVLRDVKGSLVIEINRADVLNHRIEISENLKTWRVLTNISSGISNLFLPIDVNVPAEQWQFFRTHHR